MKQLKHEVELLKEQLKNTKLKPQLHNDPVDLFVAGLKLRPRVADAAQRALSSVAENMKSRIECMASEDAVNVKGTLRMLEKAMLRREDEGNADFVRDPVRLAVKCKDMEAIAHTLNVFRNFKDITIIRLKDRFYTQPTSGGWRDIMLNFVLNDDTEKLQCEIQIVHNQMLTARKNLDGHDIYHNARNASEMLEYLGVGMSIEERSEAIRKNWGSLTDVDLEFLRQAGCTLSDLKGAGVKGKRSDELDSRLARLWM